MAKYQDKDQDKTPQALTKKNSVIEVTEMLYNINRELNTLKRLVNYQNARSLM